MAGCLVVLLAGCAPGNSGPRPDGSQLPPDTFAYDLPMFPDGPAKDGGAGADASADARCSGSIGGLLTAPFKLDLESNNGSLSGTRDWAWGSLAFSQGSGCATGTTPPTSAHSGSKVWATVLDDCYKPLDNADNACDNQDLKDDSVLSLSFQIPSCYKKATLSYWEWTDYYLPFDWTEIYVNGQSVRQDCKGNYVKPTAWVKRTFDVSAHVGKKVVVELHFMASSVVNYAGWYIDDIEVTTSR